MTIYHHDNRVISTITRLIIDLYIRLQIETIQGNLATTTISVPKLGMSVSYISIHNRIMKQLNETTKFLHSIVIDSGYNGINRGSLFFVITCRFCWQTT